MTVHMSAWSERSPADSNAVRTLQPVLFIPADQVSTSTEALSDGLWRALGEVLRWYRRQFNREVFRTHAIVECVGTQPATAYFQGTQDKVLAELSRTWGIGKDGLTYVCYGLWGEGPYQAPGNVIGATGDILVVQSSTSLVMFVDNCFPGYDRALAWNSRRAQTGALAHELGHTLGLGHTDESEPARAQDSIMYAWWDYPGVGFTPRECEVVRVALW